MSENKEYKSITKHTGVVRKAVTGLVIIGALTPTVCSEDRDICPAHRGGSGLQGQLINVQSTESEVTGNASVAFPDEEEGPFYSKNLE